MEEKGECEYMLSYIYAGVREMKIQMEKESRHSVNIKQNTKHTYEYGDKCV